MQEKSLSFRELIERDGRLLYTCKGISMLPLIKQQRDVVIIEKWSTYELKTMDVVLFVRENGQYVLHRILKIDDDKYWIAGDNCVTGEWVSEMQILGIMTAISKNGKVIRTANAIYRAYVWIWCKPWRIRIQITKLKFLVRKLVSRIFRLIRGTFA